MRFAKALIPPPLRPSAKSLYRSLIRRARPQRFAHGADPSVLNCATAYNVYGGYCVPLSALHRPAARAIVAGNVWELQTIEFLTSHCGDGDLIHAGTFFGDFLPALARSRRGGARVWAFEPNRESCRCASITVAINGLENVVLANAALGERLETRVLQTSNPDGTPLGGGSRILDAEAFLTVAGANIDRVPIVTLDSTVPYDRTVSLIHLDVEGFETQALTGAGNIIRRCLPVIVVESIPNEDWLAENLLPLGYRVGPCLDGNAVLLPPGKMA
jgi:FkbM family methyltransferase